MVDMGGCVSSGGDLLQREHIRQFDETSGLWYMIHWDEVLKCYVSQLAPGQDTSMAVDFD